MVCDKLCVKDGVCVYVKDGVLRSCVWKIACVCVSKLYGKGRVWESGVWQSCVWKMARDDCVWKMVCDEVVCDKVVCVWASCKGKMGCEKVVCDKVLWERWCVTKRRRRMRRRRAGYRIKNNNPTQRCGEQTVRNRRTHELPFIAGCSHFTRENTVFRAPASSPTQVPCNNPAGMTMRFAPLPYVSTSLSHTSSLRHHFPKAPPL